MTSFEPNAVSVFGVKADPLTDQWVKRFAIIYPLGYPSGLKGWWEHTKALLRGRLERSVLVPQSLEVSFWVRKSGESSMDLVHVQAEQVKGVKP
jgi:hypothetical protein